MNEKKYYRGYLQLTKQNEKKAYRIATKHLKRAFAKSSGSYLAKPDTPIELLVSEDDTLKMLIEIYDAVGIPMAAYVYGSLPTQKHASLQLETKARKPKQYNQTPDQSDIVNYWKAEFLRYTQSKDCAKKVSQVTKTTKESIRKVIEQGVKEQLSHKQVAKLILEKADQIDTKKRALLIARTEHAVGSNQGAMYAAKSSGLVLYKKWIARSGDSRTRDAHAGMVGSDPIPMDQAFEVGDYKMMHPGDSSFGAGASMICNCRCICAFIPASEIVQAGLNPKPKRVSKPRPVKQPDLFDKPIVIDDPNVFKPASTVAEAIEFAQNNIARNVDLYWVKDVEIANRINKVAFELKNEFDLDRLKHFATKIRGKGEMAANFDTLNIKHASFNSQNTIQKNFIPNAEKRKILEQKLTEFRVHYAETKDLRSLSIIQKYEAKLRFTNGWTVEYGAEKHLENTLIHEYGHIIHDQILEGLNKIRVIAQRRVNTPLYLDDAIKLQDEHLANYRRARFNADIYKISEYGSINQGEFFAESFVMYKNNDVNLPIYLKEFFDKLKNLSMRK